MVLGPGSALYGPNVTNGILHIITKSPFASRGTNVSITAGENNLFLDLLVTDDIFGFEGADLAEYAYGLRGVGVPETGFNFERDPDFGLSFYSTVLPGRLVTMRLAYGF